MEPHQQLVSTFWLADRLYGVDVMHVQEISLPMAFTRVPLAPRFVRGLINLRGQIATLVDLRELFSLPELPNSQPMFVFCQSKGVLLALQVDQIGDVIETSAADFEPPPEVIPVGIRKLMGGVYKVKNELLSILKVEAILEELTHSTQAKVQNVEHR